MKTALPNFIKKPLLLVSFLLASYNTSLKAPLNPADLICEDESTISFVIKDLASLLLKKFNEECSLLERAQAISAWNNHPFFGLFIQQETMRTSEPRQYNLLNPALKEQFNYLQEGNSKKIPFDALTKIVDSTIAHFEDIRRLLGDKVFYQIFIPDNLRAPELERATSPDATTEQVKPIYSAIIFSKMIIRTLTTIALKDAGAGITPSIEAICMQALSKIERYSLKYAINASKKTSNFDTQIQKLNELLSFDLGVQNSIAQIVTRIFGYA